MGITNYINFEESIIGERPLSGSRVNYAVDAIGSITGTLSGGTLQNSYSYKPYGAQLARTGPATDPPFKWVGARGYRAVGRSFCECYVRARFYSTQLARWIASDPLWPQQTAYGYLQGNPVNSTDPSGLLSCKDQRSLCYNDADLALWLCRKSADLKRKWETDFCGTPNNPDYWPCYTAAYAKYVAKVEQCGDENKKRLALCEEEYEACLEGAEANRRAFWWGVLTVSTVILFETAKDTGAVLSGQPELIAVG